MIRYDYHIHTSHSFDSYASIEAVIQSAEHAGLREIAITDHIDFSYPDNKVVSPLGAEANIAKVHRARREHDGYLSILGGVELGLRPDVANAAMQITERLDYDLVLGSTHEFYEVSYGSHEYYEGLSKQEAYLRYFANLYNTICSVDAWDVLGHIDYIKRYGMYRDKSLHYHEYRDIIDAILIYVISAGKGIEVNTSGIGSNCGIIPDIGILARYKELGGEILTVGSDAHSPEGIAHGFEEALAVLQDVGIRYITAFKRRKPSFIKIE